MAMVINTNIMSLNAQRNLNKTNNMLATSMERLSTGLRINSAKDDAAGLAISERMTSQIRGLNQAIRNANDGISFAQTAEGALSTMGDSIQRIRELAVQAINDTNSSSDRQALNDEVQQLIAEVNRIANTTQFNGQNILDGSLSSLTFQVGANQNQTISVDGVDARGSKLGAAEYTGKTFNATNLASMVSNNDLVINGESVDLTGASSTQDVVDAINKVSADSGVRAAKASTNSVTLAYTADSGDDRVLTINNVDITISAGATEDDVVAAINKVSAQTGVTATGDGSGNITFTADNAADMTIAQNADPTSTGASDIFAGLDTGGTAAAGAALEETYMAGIVLSTEVDGTVTVSGTDVTDIGLTSGSLTMSNKVLSAVDVLTGANANDALRTLDYALEQVNSLRSELGAVQTRFESTIANLSISAENLTAARSRIQDADFAAETAAMTRAQILQQAGVAMVSQANAAPQVVLSLLQ